MRLRVLLPLALAAATPISSLLAEPPLTAASFRDRLAAAIGRPATNVDDHSFTVTAADGTELTVNIDNAYAAYLADPGALDAIVSRYAQGLSARQELAEPIEQLVVIVRPSDYLQRSMPAGASQANLIAPRPMAGDLSYFLAVDSPTTIRSATPSDLARWHVDEATAWQRAVANIRPRVGPLTLVRLGGQDGPIGLSAESGLAPSALADPGICGPAVPEGLNRQIVLVNSRDTFLFAVPADAGMLRAFWQAVKGEVGAGRSISSTPLTCQAGRWVVATAPAR